MASAPAHAADRPKGDVLRFAAVPAPGAPAPVVIAPDGAVYTATLNAESGETAAPSKVFAYGADGALKRQYVIQGQNLSEQHGLTGMALDADGFLYIGSIQPAAVLRLNPRTGEQTTYAAVRDVPTCGSATNSDCQQTSSDKKPWPDYVVFAPDGTLYMTDSLQALIWKIPPGGGKAEVWLTDPRLESLIGSPGFGPSAMKLAPDNKTLYFTTVQGPPGDGDPSAGAIWKLPIQPDGKPGPLTLFYRAQSADGPGGIGFARSGDIYVAMSGSNAIAQIGPDGKERARFPDPVANMSFRPPLDGPIDVAFRGKSLLVANSAFLSGSASNWALLDVFVGEEGHAPIRPKVPGTDSAAAQLRLTVAPKRVVVGRRARMRFRVTGSSGAAVGGARIRVGRTHVRSDKRGRATAFVTIRHAGTKRATVRARGFRPTHAKFRAVRRG